jgi:hypothetical protein
MSKFRVRFILWRFISLALCSYLYASGMAEAASTTKSYSCLTITSPAFGSVVRGSTVSISTIDTCKGAWFESLFVDGNHVADFAPGKVALNSTMFSNGAYLVGVTAQSAKPNSVRLGMATVTLSVQNPISKRRSTPTASPTPTATPSPAFFAVQPSGIAYPTNATCAAAIATSPETVVKLPNDTNCSGAAGSSLTSNGPFNAGVPTAAELSAYAANGYTFNWYPSDAQFARVDGQYPAVIGTTPSTDMILRYAACKFGLDEDVIRAQAMQESGWQQGGAGDSRTGAGSCVQGGFTGLYNQAIPEPDGNTIPLVPNGCCQSWSLLQTKAFYEWMTWPMIMRDTSFAAEYLGAALRTCMDGGYLNYMGGAASQYGMDYTNYVSNPNGYNGTVPNYYSGSNPSLQPTNANRMLWGCIGTHYAGYDWYDSISNPYIQEVQQHLHNRDWP